MHTHLGQRNWNELTTLLYYPFYHAQQISKGYYDFLSERYSTVKFKNL